MSEFRKRPGGGTLIGVLPEQEGSGPGRQRRVKGNRNQCGVIVGDGIGQDGGKRAAFDDLGEGLNRVRLHRDSGLDAVLCQIRVDMAAGGKIAAE